MIGPEMSSGLIGSLRGIAQSGSAPALGAGCREFESLYPDHFFLRFVQVSRYESIQRSGTPTGVSSSRESGKLFCPRRFRGLHSVGLGRFLILFPNVMHLMSF